MRSMNTPSMNLEPHLKISKLLCNIYKFIFVHIAQFLFCAIRRSAAVCGGANLANSALCTKNFSKLCATCILTFSRNCVILYTENQGGATYDKCTNNQKTKRKRRLDLT